MIRAIQLMVACVACVAIVATAGQAQAGVITNPSFETGDFSGWTLFEGDDLSPAYGIWGNVSTGTTITNSTPVYDHYNQASFTSFSPGLPRTYTATDGSRLAIQLQNGAQFHRMYQDVSLSAADAFLTWDMFYHNHSPSFAVNDDTTGAANGGQYLAVRLRDTSDNLLATLFVTNPGDPLSIPMSSFSGDVRPFAGTTVRISVEMDVDNYFLDAGFDNFVVAVPEPSSTALFGIGACVAGLRAARRRRREKQKKSTLQGVWTFVCR